MIYHICGAKDCCRSWPLLRHPREALGREFFAKAHHSERKASTGSVVPAPGRTKGGENERVHQWLRRNGSVTPP